MIYWCYSLVQMNTLHSSYKSGGNTLKPSSRYLVEKNTKFTNQAIVFGQKWCAIAQMIIGIVSTVSGIITLSSSRSMDGTKYTQKCRAIDNSSFGMWSGMVCIKNLYNFRHRVSL